MIPFRWNNPAYLTISTAAPLPVEDVLSVSIDMSVGQHDMAKIRCAGMRASVLSSLDNMPIILEWGSAQGRPQRFIGYVVVTGARHSFDKRGITNDLKPAALYESTLTCLGATSDMKEGGQDVWHNLGIGQMLSDIASRFRYTFECEEHPYRWPRLAMGGRSYWEFASLMAEQVGYHLIGNGTHLRLVDPTAALARAVGVPVLRSRDVFQNTAGETLLAQFSPQLGSYTATGHQGTKLISGLNANTGDRFTINSELMVRDRTGLGRQRNTSTTTLTPVLPAHDFEMAMTLATGYERQNMWSHTATAVAFGGSGLEPGAVVSIEGFNADFEGLWYVLSTQHRVGGSLYEVEMKLGKDSLGAADNSARPRTHCRGEASQPLLLNGRWVASVKRGVASV